MVAIQTQKIADIVAAHIETLILEGVLRPGEKLAPERELALKLDVSRPSLRDALEKLCQRGLLTASRGGTYVAQFLTPIMKPLASLFRDNKNAAADYFEFRQAVEVQAARLAALRATNVDKAAIRACLAEMRKAHKISDPAEEAQADVNLHILVYEAGHNMIMLHVMRALSDMLRNNIFFNREHLYRRAGVRERLLIQHIDIGEAVLRGKPEAAEKAASDHIKFVFGTVEDIQRDNIRLESALRRAGRNELLAD
jgi:GntR family transcriptional repressor for pyruvate dehydrogenase complex